MKTTTMHEMVEHRYSDKPRRCYVDGVRIGRFEFDWMMEQAHKNGRVWNMQTRAHPYGEGNTHRINSQTIELTRGA